MRSCNCQYCDLEACMAYSEASDNKPQHSYYQQENNNNGNDECYIYNNPIRITPEALQQGHYMGITLQLILTFNIALAHHLRAIAHGDLHLRGTLKKVLQLYEVAYRWKMQEEIPSLRFSMVIANTLGQIHRAAGNYAKYIMCLQHVLSSMVFIVECNQHQHTTHPQQYNNTTNCSGIQLDGFVRNTSKLILQGQCAAAA